MEYGPEAGFLYRSDCARARALSSLWPDGELSELEEAQLDAHLADCAACRAFGLAVAGSTVALRETPLEQFQGSVIVPRRGWGRRYALRLGGYSAAAAAAVAMIGVYGSSQALHPGRQPQPGNQPFVSEAVEESHAKRASLLAQIDRSWVPRSGSRDLLQ